MDAAATAADHYVVLGLPSGEEGARLSEQEITKAYRSKARELHPDKRRSDPHAHDNFLKLQSSYQVLKDETKRKLFDDDLRRQRPLRSIKRDCQINRQQNDSSKRRKKMMSDLRKRELIAAAAINDRGEKDIATCRKLKEEMASIIAIERNKKVTSTTTKPKQGTTTESEGKFNYPRRMYNIAVHDQAYEDSVLAKLRSAAPRQTQT